MAAVGRVACPIAESTPPANPTLAADRGGPHGFATRARVASWRVTRLLVSSLRAPRPTQLAAASGELDSRRATFTAAAFSARFRLPIMRSAQLTDLLH